MLLIASALLMSVATFRADVTPAPGEPLIWVQPTTQVLDPLWAEGVIIDDGRARYVLCAVDWCGLSNSTHRLFRGDLAAAAGTDFARVVLTTVHQHSAPYIDGDAYREPAQFLRMSDRFLNDVSHRLIRAAKEARFEKFDRIGTGEAKADRVASTRRILKDGKVIVRYSNGAKNPEIAAFPEGAIDPEVKTVTFAQGSRPLVRLHYYATHPQTFCCDGRVSGDFVSAAREAVERKEKVFQIYFTGCSGDVTVGKYNDGSEEARTGLAQRLEAALMAAIASTRLAPATAITWRTAPLVLPPKTENTEKDPYRAAIRTAFAQRKTPLEVSSLSIGNIQILHLPGEPMLEFQMYAQRLRPGRFVAVAGYGDLSPGYLCTDKAFAEGGYEPGASNAGPGTEARVKEAIQNVLIDRRP